MWNLIAGSFTNGVLWFRIIFKDSIQLEVKLIFADTIVLYGCVKGSFQGTLPSAFPPFRFFRENLNGAAENGTGDKVRAMLTRCSGSIETKKRPDGIKPYERNRVYFAVQLHGIVHTSDRIAPLLGTGFFQLVQVMGTVKKGKNRHGGNPPMCRHGFTRCQVVVGLGQTKRNDGSDFSKPPPEYVE